MKKPKKKIRVLHFDKIYSISIDELYSWFVFQMNDDENYHKTAVSRRNLFVFELTDRFKELKVKPIFRTNKKPKNYHINLLDITIDEAIDEMELIVTRYLSNYYVRDLLNANGV